MTCPMTSPGFCTECNRRVRWAELQVCERKHKVMTPTTPCICPGPGFCTKFNRQMHQDDWDICSGGVAWLKSDYVKRWIKESGTSCAFDGGPLLDEYGVPVKKRGCGCGSQPAVLSLKVCSHPQMIAAKTHGQDGCESRCSFFQSKPSVDAVKQEDVTV